MAASPHGSPSAFLVVITATRVGEPTRVIARLPATVTIPIEAGETHEFAVPRGRLRFFDAGTGRRADPVPIGG